MAIATVVILVSGCSYSYVDKNGVQHTIGLVKLSVPVVPTGNASAGSIVEVTTLGVAGYRTPRLSGFSIGYNRERLMSLKNNVIVTDRSITELLENLK